MSDESFLAKRAVAQSRPIRRMEGCRGCENVFLEGSQKVNHEAGVTANMDGKCYRINSMRVRNPPVAHIVT